MNGLSARYAWLLLGTLVVAAGAAWFYDHVDRPIDTCADPDALMDASRIAVPTKSTESGRLYERRLRLDGAVPPPEPGGNRLAVTVRRTFTAAYWLMRPTLALPGALQPTRVERSVREIDGVQVPVTTAYVVRRSSTRFTRYVFAYEREAITSPFRTRLTDAVRALSSGVRPITMIGVAGSAHYTDLPEVEARADEWLDAAWRHYQTACRGHTGT